MTISGWGNNTSIKSEVSRPESLEQLIDIVSNATKIIPFGNLRSYGDSALGSSSIDMKHLDKVLAFDTKSGTITVEAGILLSDLINIALPKGWFTQVVPGTTQVTIGGAIASNIHGKNHHKVGSFASCVKSMQLVLADGTVVTCSRNERQDLFWATLGGMGLTAVIYAATLQLKRVSSNTMDASYIRCPNLNRLLYELQKTERDHEYTVAWLDCLAQGKKRGKGIVIAGNHSKKGTLKPIKTAPRCSVPFFMPHLLLNKASMKLFNILYYLAHPTASKRTSLNSFFFPLDSVGEWNKMYGRRGFIQYQCVIPKKDAQRSLHKILHTISQSGVGSFLTVLKEFKKADPLLSFPMPGYTLALDFPFCKATKKLVKKLDKLVLRYDGRTYLTKDSLTTPTAFAAMYPQLDKWRKIKYTYDPQKKFTSNQARRLQIL